MKRSSYKIELIDVVEKDRLFEKYESRYLHTCKASIYACCIKLLTDVEYVKERLDDNFFTMSEDVRSHGSARYLKHAGVSMVNTTSAPHETQKAIRKIVAKGNWINHRKWRD